MKRTIRAVPLIVATAGVGLSAGKKIQQEAEVLEPAEDENCANHRCSDGWVPFKDHHERFGTSDKECCKPTCKLWECTGDYIPNPEYFKNIGSSNEQCCDLSCSAFTCPPGQKVPQTKEEVASVNSTECCFDTCSLATCDPYFTLIPDRKQDIPLAGREKEHCCRKTCRAYSCDYRNGLTNNPEHNKLSPVNDDTCCTATCETLRCKKGYAMPKSKRYEIAEGNPNCCQPTCERHQCSPGWVKDPARQTSIGQTNEACCMKTCEIYHCGDGWALNPEAKEFIDVDDPTCCLKQCIQHQDKCIGDYAPSVARNDTVAETNDACCEKTCALHNCTRGIPIPEPRSVVSNVDSECCEDPRCPTFRNKTIRPGGCNGLGEDVCNMSYVILLNTVTNKNDTLGCAWMDELKLCRLTSDKEPSWCA
eukprot:gb/GFBE01002860.1/.p2 GENE.gb/GFBE01002860.1/~~gb/GFBE01002860.1/.p2  ORF type:complete len:420 (-),score=83.58 gb/GFBE01002860.1/:7-1266(-)